MSKYIQLGVSEYQNQADWSKGKKGTHHEPGYGHNKPCMNLYYIGMDSYHIDMNSYVFVNGKYSF